MTDRHRGADPRDRVCFAPAALPRLRTATGELSWLLARGYPHEGSLELVGNRHQLRARQRQAIQRCAAGKGQVADRLSRRKTLAELEGGRLAIDGYNVLLTVEAALSGAPIFEARDSTFRDLSTLNRHYRRVAETHRALELIGRRLVGLKAVTWLFDRPVSNSGRLKKAVLELATEQNWPWTAELVDDPDRDLRRGTDAVASADSAILDDCRSWLNLARLVV